MRAELITAHAFIANNVYGALTTLAATALFLGSFACLLRIETRTAFYWLAELGLATSMYQAFVILHDCGHGSLFANRRANHLVGLVAGAACLMPFFPWKDLHRIHHRPRRRHSDRRPTLRVGSGSATSRP